MRSGPKAILYQSALFRTSELVWVKVAPLTVWRQLIRWSLIACGVIFFVIVAQAKGGEWRNLEGVLGLLAWHVGYWMQSDTRLASTGDLQESYLDRGGNGSTATFKQWVNALSEGDDEQKLRNAPRYEYWFNLQRIAWAAPCWIVEFYPLVLIPVFLGYNWLISPNPLTDHELVRQALNVPVLQDINFLSFERSSSFVHFLCWLIAGLGLLATATSVSHGVVIRASGGLTDRFALSARDRDAFFHKLAGMQAAAVAVPVEIPANKPEPVVPVVVEETPAVVVSTAQPTPEV